ncbi:GGDEF domain-containing protein [Alicyclobacillaceae bacterium I2511]|nr:GGDEF domain-containing protein [Alicyclobacillaceae bacterium I2511]
MVQTEIQFNVHKWNRQILNFYWWATLASLVLELTNLFFSRVPHDYYLFHYVLWPTGILVVLVLLTETFAWKFVYLVDKFIPLTAILISETLLVAHPSVHVLRISILLPVIISAFYFRITRLVWVTAVSLLVFLATVLVDPSLHGDPTGLITVLGLMGMCAVLMHGIMRRSLELLQHLNETNDNLLKLQVQNILVERAAKIDALTGVYNQNAFQQFLQEVLQHLQGSRIHLLLLDVDDFKQINDQFGHLAGNAVLQAVAHAIQQGLRSQDFVSRYGGDEFAALLMDTDFQETQIIVQRLREEIAHLDLPEIEGHVTVSIGLHQLQPKDTADSVFQMVDTLLYDAKRRGKNQVASAFIPPPS